MVASTWLLEARTSEVENQEAQGRSWEPGVGSEEANFQRPSKGPSCSPPLCHPVAERLPWLHMVAGLQGPSGGPLVLCLYGRVQLTATCVLPHPSDHLPLDHLPIAAHSRVS